MSKDLLIAIFTGWFGGYRFYKKQYFMGMIYFCTGGLFFFGWLYDILKASRSEVPTPVPIAVINTKVVGVTYPPSKKSNFSSRQEVLNALSGRFKRKGLLYLEFFEYEGFPAYRVVYKTLKVDIGNLSQELASSIYKKYKDNFMIISDFQVTGGPDDGEYQESSHKDYGCNIKIEIY